jgi:hypothetical protein
MLTLKGYKFHYLKTKRGAKTPDYLVEHEREKFVIEIGGKGKGREQFKGIKIEKKLILCNDPKAGSGKKPLSLMGFIK